MGTVLCCMWAPGLALRGPEGIKSFHHTVDFLRSEQQQMYFVFIISVLSYFLSSCCLVWVYPSRTVVNSVCTGTLAFFLVCIVILQIKLEFQIGGCFIPHDGADGKIHSFLPFEQIADLDQFVAKRAPEHNQPPCPRPGMYTIKEATETQRFV